jgi:two-component system response regulator YesN
MAILSNRLIRQVNAEYHRRCGVRSSLMDLLGTVSEGSDPLAELSNTRRRRDFALQEGINRGQPYVFNPCPHVYTWVVGLEDRRKIHGGLLGGEVRVEGSLEESRQYLVSHGMGDASARGFLRAAPLWPEDRIPAAARLLEETFYKMSGWQPVLMRENRLKIGQQEQIAQAIEDQKRHGQPALYAFEKERVLLANIRAGDRNGAREILNEMLATIYMSSPQLVVLRARTVELMSCLTRAAIEDNPLMEPLIERNHAWTERLIGARDFEQLSRVLMEALDDFIDGIYLHGSNRSNTRVRQALEIISRDFASKISLRTVAREVGLSPCRLSHLVKDFTGRTVLQIIQEARVRHAQQLLERTSRTCAQIAYDVGFGDQSYFIKHFRRLTGTTPGRYRKSRGPNED